jgi:hypothetical protein
MRYGLLMAIASAVWATAAASPAQARPWYPWCSVYWTPFGGEHRNCGFVSFEQCRRNQSSGLGDVCLRNNWDPPPQLYLPDGRRPRKR